jgi:hypothetical protein
MAAAFLILITVSAFCLSTRAKTVIDRLFPSYLVRFELPALAITTNISGTKANEAPLAPARRLYQKFQ